MSYLVSYTRSGRKTHAQSGLLANPLCGTTRGYVPVPHREATVGSVSCRRCKEALRVEAGRLRREADRMERE